MHAQYLQEPNGDTIWTKIQLSRKDTQRSVKTKCSPNYIKEANQHMIDNKPNQHMNDH
jgi:hypothetical protein